MREFVIGDIHGEYQKLIKCLKAVNFDYQNDKLIQLGDIVDRGPHSYHCIEELKLIKNLILIKGNHDECWFEGLYVILFLLGVITKKWSVMIIIGLMHLLLEIYKHYTFKSKGLNPKLGRYE